MKCPSCMQSKGRDKAPELKVEESTDHIYMKCPECCYRRGNKKTGYKK